MLFRSLVVAHGGVISVYLCHLLGISFNSLWRMRIDNCSLTIARPPRLVSVNDTAHLPPAPQTKWFEVSEAGGRSEGVPPVTRVVSVDPTSAPRKQTPRAAASVVAGGTPSDRPPASDTDRVP